MPRVGADAVNIQTKARIEPTPLRSARRTLTPGMGPPTATPGSYDLPEVVAQGGDPNAFTNAIRELVAQNPGVVWTVQGPAASFGPFTAVNVQEGVDPISPYGNAQGAPRGDRVYFLGPVGWVFAASVSGYWYATPSGKDVAGRSGPAFRCGTLPSGAPDYSCFPLLNLGQGTLPTPDEDRYGRQPRWAWTPSPEPELEPEGVIVLVEREEEAATNWTLPILLGIGAAVLLGR